MFVDGLTISDLIQKGGFMNDDPLDSSWREYRQGTLDRRALETMIFRHITKNPGRFGLKSWPDDQRSDFLSWFYPYLRRAIDHYQNQGSSFDAYIHTLVKYRSIQFRAAEAEGHLLEQCYWRFQAPEPVNDTHYSVEVHDSGGCDIKNPDRVLMLALKCCYYVSDSFVSTMARTLKMPENGLRRLFDELKRRKSDYFDHLNTMRSRIERQYLRCIGLSQRLSVSPSESSRHRELEQGLRRSQRRLSALRDQYRRMPKSATNKEVAELLGLPKGTVDFGVAAIKKVYGSNMLNDKAD